MLTVMSIYTCSPKRGECAGPSVPLVFGMVLVRTLDRIIHDFGCLRFVRPSVSCHRLSSGGGGVERPTARSCGRGGGPDGWD